MRKKSKILSLLHKQRAGWSVLLLTIVSLFLGVCLSDFYTKGEPREAMVAQAMIRTGDYVLPPVYGSEYAYKPPMMHWMIAGLAQLNGGEVTEPIARIPSAVGLTVIVMATFSFLSTRVRYRTSYLATLVLLTTFEVHRSGITARIDMLLTMFMVLTLFTLFIWEEQEELKGVPWWIPLLMSGGVLTKGPVAIILPLLIFGVYLLLFRKYSLWKIIYKLALVALLSAILPAVWYYLAWQRGGDEFLVMAFAENIARFLHLDTPELHYPLGHAKPIYHIFILLATAALPWTFLLFFAPWWKRETYEQRPTGEERLSNMRFRSLNGLRKVHLYAVIVVVVTLIFFAIPVSKRSVYLLPLFPFLAVIIAETLQQMAKCYRKSLVAFSIFMAVVGMIMITGLILIMTGGYEGIMSSLGMDTPKDIQLMTSLQSGLNRHLAFSVLLIFALLIAVLATFYQIVRKGFTKLAFCTVLVMFMIHLNIDGPLMMGFKKDNSAKRFAEVVQPIIENKQGQLFTVSDLNNGLYNLYGLAFYCNIYPRDFIAEQPERGYLILWEKNLQRIEESYMQSYDLVLVERDIAPIQEGGVALLMWFEKR